MQKIGHPKVFWFDTTTRKDVRNARRDAMPCGWMALGQSALIEIKTVLLAKRYRATKQKIKSNL